jgi:hypothetical protein
MSYLHNHLLKMISKRLEYDIMIAKMTFLPLKYIAKLDNISIVYVLSVKSQNSG